MHRSRFANSVRPLVGLLMAVETAVLCVSIYVAIPLRFGGDVGTFAQEYGATLPKAVFFAGVMVLSLLSLGLYQLSQRLYLRDALVRLIVAFLLGSIALSAFWFLVPPLALSRTVAGIAVLISFAFLLVLRFVYMQHVDENLLRRRSLVYGSPGPVRALSRLRRRADRRGFRVVGLILANGTPDDCYGYPVERHDRPLMEIVRQYHADEIVVALDERRGTLPVRELLAAKLTGVEIIDFATFMERESRKIYIDLISPGWMVFGEGFRNDWFRRLIKRAFDTAFASAALLLLWPVVLVTAVAIKLEDGWKAPVFYRQMRVGARGVPFKLLKFRSMREDAEADGVSRWAEIDDRRVSRVGHWIRKWRIDEIPQLYNVLGGYMSIVGPRPERPDFVAQLAGEIAYYNERHAAKPGITGWAQLRYQYGSSVNDALEKLQYDLYYVKNQSVILDMVILLQTVEVILWGKGAR